MIETLYSLSFFNRDGWVSARLFLRPECVFVNADLDLDRTVLEHRGEKKGYAGSSACPEVRRKARGRTVTC